MRNVAAIEIIFDTFASPIFLRRDYESQSAMSPNSYVAGDTRVFGTALC